MKHLLRIILALLPVSLSGQEAPRVAYEIFVRSFCDSDGDGIGDLNGISAKLDYLAELGVDLIWLTPVSPSPSYHKYDVMDYRGIEPEYGTLDDYKELVKKAHARGIKVIKDLVINHSSEQHPWFLEAVKGPENPYRDFYVWMTPDRIDSLGIAVREGSPDSWELNPWHWAVEGETEKYYGLFSGVMPDLNYDNPVVRDSIFAIGQWWLRETGVDGFRLDAAKHIYPQWEAEKAHAFWQAFREEMEKVNEDVFLVGEVYADAEIVAPFFRGLGANFNIQMSEKLPFMVREGRDSDLVEFLLESYGTYTSENPAFVDATLLTNHDQNRVGSVLEGRTEDMKVAANLLLTLPGLPFLYYGEEIGMLGQKPDPQIREPFLWQLEDQDPDRTRWTTPQYSTDSAVAPLAVQRKDAQSLYRHYRKLIALRKSRPALAQVRQPNLLRIPVREELIAFVRPHTSGDVLVVHNLSDSPQQFTVPGEYFKLSRKLWKPRGLKPLGTGQWSLPAKSMLILAK